MLPPMPEYIWLKSFISFIIKYLLKVDVLQIQSNIDITLTMCNLYFLSNFESFNDGRFTLGYISRSMFLRYYSNEYVVVVIIGNNFKLLYS